MEDSDHSFWMKNTYIGLDLVYLDSAGKVAGIAANVPPLSTESRRVGAPSRFVLEVGSGWCAEHGVARGQRSVITLAAE